MYCDIGVMIMAASSILCPKCAGTMERGIVAVLVQGVAVMPKWYKGDVEGSCFSLSSTAGKEVNVNIAYRCVACGFIEYYAK
jgi:hypothetical protein